MTDTIIALIFPLALLIMLFNEPLTKAVLRLIERYLPGEQNGDEETP